MLGLENRRDCHFVTTIRADPAAMSLVLDRVTSILEQNDWPEDDVIAVQLAISEALANAIRHGCGGDVTRHVQCSVSCEGTDEVVIVVRDPGPGFDLDIVRDPLDPEHSPNPSSRGIFLLHGLMDDVLFGLGGSEVQMRKRRSVKR